MHAWCLFVVVFLFLVDNLWLVGGWGLGGLDLACMVMWMDGLID